MPTPADPAEELAEFDAHNSAEGLERRYARGRIRNFANRQILTASGALTLWFLVGPVPAIVAALTALAGEIVDCAWLATALRRGLDRRNPATFHAITVLTACIQALTISVCVAIAWRLPPDHAGRFFAIAFLAGAAVNAGLVLPYHRRAATARLTIYAALPVMLFAADLADGATFDQALVFDLLGTLLFGYMVVVFLAHFVASALTQRAQRRGLLVEKLRLAEKEKEAERLAVVARVANDSVIITDPDRRIVWVNETFTRLTGYTAEEVVGRDPGAVLNGPGTAPETVARIEAAARAGRPCRAEIENRRKDGSTVWIEASLTPVHDAEGRHVMTVSVERDITEARRRAAELEAAREAAEAGMRAKSEFLATMSHEIRTPLNGIIGMADLLADTRLTKRQRECVETILGSGTALVTIINDILDFSRLEAGKITVDALPYDPARVLNDCMALIEPLAAAKGLDLVAEVDLPAASIVGDPGRVRQIVLNLLGNAVKFTERGSVTLNARREGDHWAVAVQDTGIGIAPDRQDAVFERFTQADGATTRQFGGTGLGLAISRELARLMGGDITVRSEPGAGSTFTLNLPYQAADTADDAPDATDTHVLPPGLRVLVAEDNRTNRLLMERMLKRLQAETRFAEDGQQAVEAARERWADAILMDMSMPRLDGVAATQRIRAEEHDAGHPPVPIIALTANAFDDDRERCLAAGMTDFLSKPARKAELAAALARAAGTRGAQAA